MSGGIASGGITGNVAKKFKSPIIPTSWRGFDMNYKIIGTSIRCIKPCVHKSILFFKKFTIRHKKFTIRHKENFRPVGRSRRSSLSLLCYPTKRRRYGVSRSIGTVRRLKSIGGCCPARRFFSSPRIFQIRRRFRHNFPQKIKNNNISSHCH